MASFDYDVVIIGSGFGGSVSALRAAEKGYRVGVMESGKRWNDEDIPQSQWHLPGFLWFPAAELYGIQRVEYLDDVLVLAGAGVGGGSHVYANTLYVPPKQFFDAPEWASITDWADELAPHYDQATRMLGAVRYPYMPPMSTASCDRSPPRWGEGKRSTRLPSACTSGARASRRRPVLRRHRPSVNWRPPAARPQAHCRGVQHLPPGARQGLTSTRPL